MKFGDQLRSERNKRELTQEAVATELFVSRQTISSWETGRSYPDIDSLIALSNLYDISLDRLLKEDNGMVEDIRRKAAMKESQLLLGASSVVNLLLLGLVLLKANGVSGFDIGDYSIILLVLIMFGNLFILMYAKTKLIQLAPKKDTGIQRRVQQLVLPILSAIGVGLLIASRISAIVTKETSTYVSGLGAGIIGAVLVAGAIKLLIKRFRTAE